MGHAGGVSPVSSGSFTALPITSPLGCSKGIAPFQLVVLGLARNRSLHLGVRLIVV